jgi:single-stranded-DNA-specific exonuclease
MTFLNTRWQIAPPPPPDHASRFKDVDRFLLQILYQRGLTEPSEVEAFLARRPPNPDDPFQLQGMREAVERIARAISEEESIAIYGDFDADGVTASVLLVQALRAMGAARVQPYIPHRIKEGYGLNREALGKLAKQGNRLVITVDCGIRAVEQIREARQIGLDVIVTDHHTVSAGLPSAVAVIDPKREDDWYPNPGLAGVGVAFKLVQGLTQAGLKMKELAEEELLDLVALGTVADLAPLLGENRSLVYRGLQIINAARRPGIAALLGQSGVKPGQATVSTIGYGLGPRINAAGRMAHAYDAAKLLITPDPEEAQLLAERLNTLNRERQEMTREMTDRAMAMAVEDGEDTMLLFAADRDFPSGIVGLIASRLAESHYRPTVVVHVGDETAVGSCRSIAEFHITDALDHCEPLLIKHGGHAAAAGFTVEIEKLPDLRERLNALANEQLSCRVLTPQLTIDTELELGDLVFLRRVFENLEPCGYANPTPLVLSRNVRVHHARVVGRDKAHLKLTLAEGDRTYDGIAFRMGHHFDELQDRMDVVYHLEENEWNGRINLQLNIQDMRPAGEEYY